MRTLFFCVDVPIYYLCFMYSIICQVCDYLMHTVLITSCVGYSRRILGEKFVLDFLTRFKRHCLRNVRGFEGPENMSRHWDNEANLKQIMWQNIEKYGCFWEDIIVHFECKLVISFFFYDWKMHSKNSVLFVRFIPTSPLMVGYTTGYRGVRWQTEWEK